jgi:DNA repair exonuclease SbcCD ATPase subunit
MSQNLLKEQEEEANEAIAIWELKAENLEKDLDEAEQQLVRLREILNVDTEDIDLCAVVESKLKFELQIQTKLTESEERLDAAKKTINDLSSKCESLSESEKELKSHFSELEEQFEAKIQKISQQLASKSRGKLEEERDRLAVVITQLEEELREANEMVQACITNESGDKATEAAAQALRENIRELNLQLSDLNRKHEDEKSARELASLEAERLREDVAALVSLTEKDGLAASIENLTTQAIEKVQKRERSEIDEMKKALFRALGDLDAARCAERRSNEKLSKVRLQLSVYEQEIVAAKSEVSFLSQTMEELRETEENKRASLEYRIGSLEHEHELVRKYHAAELEGVRNELSQTTMDRDRVLQQLKETEKTNASLVYAGFKSEDNAVEDVNDLEFECTKLRIENAHLLTMAADDKARAERRLREMLAAQAASNEADVILQTELRVSAEAAVETLKVELAALLNERRSLVERSDEAQQKVSIEQTEELQSTRSSLEKLQKENNDLKEKLRQAAREAQMKIDSLTDECRAAQAKLHKMNQEGRFEALVQTEKSKLARQSQSPERRNLSQNGNGWVIAVDNPVSQPETIGPSMSSAEAFDLIQKQKQEILEERKMYREFLQEHDSLLALLAQLDGEKNALIEALGPVVAEEIIQRAQPETNAELIANY